MAPNGTAEVHDLDAERLPFLPRSVLSEILGLLLPADLVNLAATCSTLRNMLLLPTSTAIWTRAHANKAAEAAEAEEQRPEHMNLVQLREKYYALIDGQHALHRDEFPAFSELAALRGARMRLSGAASAADVAAVGAWLVKAVNSWRAKAHETALALCAAPGGLRGARAVFRRRDEARCLVYPDMFLDGATFSIADPARALPGPDDGLRHDARGAAVVRRLCELAGLGPGAGVSQAQLDASRVRFCCLSCQPPPRWPLVLNWRQAIEHANAEHDALPEPAWARWPPSTAERAVMADGSVPAWVCLKCPSARQGVLARPAVRHHLSELHEIAQPVEGTHFARCTRTLWPPPPQSVLALHAEEVPCTVLDGDDQSPQEVLWKCRHCSAAAAAGTLFEGPDAVERLEKHLRELHHVTLAPEQAQRQEEQSFGANGHGLPTPMEVAAMLKASPFLALPPPPPHRLYPPPTQPFPAPVPASAFHPPAPAVSAFPSAPAVSAFPPAPVASAFHPPVPAVSAFPPAPATSSAPPAPSTSNSNSSAKAVPLKERFRVAGGGFAYLAPRNDEKVYGCARCAGAGAGDAKAAERRFSLNGIKMHLSSKHRTPDPVLEQDFFHQGGLRAIEILPT